MARLKNTMTGAEVDVYATTHNASSSYGHAVWADASGEAYTQVDLPSSLFEIVHDIEGERRSLGNLIRDRRQKIGLSLQQLSVASGVDTSNISKIERGSTANIDTYIRLLSALGCHLALDSEI